MHIMHIIIMHIIMMHIIITTTIVILIIIIIIINILLLTIILHHSLRFLDKQKANICAIGLWTDNSVRLLSLPTLEELHKEIVSTELPRSLLLITLEGKLTNTNLNMTSY
jgi:hypothetical protein